MFFKRGVFTLMLGAFVCAANPTLAMLEDTKGIAYSLSQQRHTESIENALEILNVTNEKIKLGLVPIKSDDPRIILNLLDKEGNELGTINCHINKDEARLNDIRLKDEYQGQGFGKPSLITFYKLMDLLNVPITTCCLQSENPYTAKFYLSIGMRFKLEELKKLGVCGDRKLFENFLQNSSMSNNNSLEMFRVGQTPFADSTPDQKTTYLKLLSVTK